MSEFVEEAVPSFTTEEWAKIRSMVAKANGSKGGKVWWNSLTEEQRLERKEKLKLGRKKASIKKKYQREIASEQQ